MKLTKSLCSSRLSGLFGLLGLLGSSSCELCFAASWVNSSHQRVEAARQTDNVAREEKTVFISE